MNTVRLADIPDIKHIHDIALELQGESVYRDVKADPVKFKIWVAGLIGSKHGRVLVVVDKDDIPQGFLLGIIDEFFFSKERHATDMATYIRKGYRRHAYRLYKTFIDWAKTKPKVFEIAFSQSSGIGDYDRWCMLMERLGLIRVGSNYTMRVT